MQHPKINSKNIIIGHNVTIHPSVKICGINCPAESVIIGDNTFIGENVQIICQDFSIGDYGKIQHHTNIHGYLPCFIGHNAWIGQYSIIDSIGGTYIGNNCGIGAHSQIWSHIKYGDTLEGCRFLSEKKMNIGNDVWFVGHCIVSPINAEDKSMAMAGSVITKDMKYNEIYAGSPAKSISEKIGFQFIEKSIDEKMAIMNDYLNCWDGNHDVIKIVENDNQIDFENKEISFFNLSKRTYTKRGTNDEISFMKYLLPAKAKFTPQ